MAYFSLVMGILIISFAAGFFCLHGKIDVLDPSINVFRQLGDSITVTFLMSVLGSFSVSELHNPLEDNTGPLSNISYVSLPPLTSNSCVSWLGWS